MSIAKFVLFCKDSQNYGGAKIAFSFFLSMYSRILSAGFLAAQHTTVCLDTLKFGQSNAILQLNTKIITELVIQSPAAVVNTVAAGD